MPTVRFTRQVIRPESGPFAALPDATCEQWSTATLTKELAELCVRHDYAEVVEKKGAPQGEVSNG